MKSANEDKKDFKSIIKSLGIFEKSCQHHPLFTKDDIKNSNNKKFPRYIREKENNKLSTPMHTCNNFLGNYFTAKNENTEALQDSINKFSKGIIDTKQLETDLKNINIDPNINEISKHIKNLEKGALNHKELMKNVMKFQSR